MMRLTHGVASDMGRKRSENQDAYLAEYDPEAYPSRPALFAVCDGAGGQRGGRTASRLAAEQVHEQFAAAADANLAQRLINAANHASAVIYEYSQRNPETEGMATTFVAAAFDAGRCYIVNVGDSRAYHVAGGELERVTTDHTLIQEQLSTGLISEEQAANSPYRHVITRYLGRQPADVGAEGYSPFPLRPGDVFILCSDGLTDMVSDEEIRSICVSASPPQAAQALVDLANDHGGRDNVTAIVIRVDEG
jgi:serine/threonine protein phosphatase PrpC